MARISKKPLWQVRQTKSLLPRDMIVVEVASFTFRFIDANQLRQCLAYYQEKIHPSSRVSATKLASELGEDWREQRGWEVERWFERLPMYLLEEPKRLKVIKALTRALNLAESGKLQA
ncbi:MAG TPA: hypothetical protein VF392_18035 [Terracidiphilus sp.]